MKKKIISLVMAAAMAASMVACGSSSATSTDEAAATPSQQTETNEAVQEVATVENSADLTDPANINNSVKRDSITVGWKDATSLDPWGTRNDNPGNYEVYEMLYECTAKGELYPILADASKGSFEQGCDHEDGSNIYTVYIYDYIKDHAGNAVTASDVAFSYNYQFTNKSTSGWDDFVEARAVDDTTIEFEFAKEQTDLGWFVNFFARCFIVNEDSFNASASELANDMCGTGPYKFVSYTSGSSLVLEANDDYWQTDESLRHQEQQANVQTITYQFVSENAQRENGLSTGALDMVNDLAFESIGDFIDGGKYQDLTNVQTYTQKFVYYLDPNCSTDSPCNDENLRKAIFSAVDVDGIITALGGAYTKLDAYACDYYTDYDMVDWASLDNYNTKTGVDAAEVQGYLDASNYNGETLTLMVQPEFSNTATIIAAQLAAYGINVELLQVDSATATTTQADPTAWDLYFGMMAGEYNVQVWLHDFSYNNSASGTETTGFIVDDEWNDMLNTVNSEAGHTSENMQAWWEMAVEHAYCMGIYAGNSYNVVPASCTYVCQGDKLTLIPGACCFTE